MIRQILGWLLAAIVVVFALVWIMGGGITRGVSAAKQSSNPLDFFMNLDAFRLPWQPASTLDLPQFSATSTDDLIPGAVPLPEDAKTFGYTSPYLGKVIIASRSAAGADPNLEYIEIDVLGASPVSLAGWSLQSAYSRVRVPLPAATENLVSGSVNRPGELQAPGGSVIYAVSGRSPIGVSFRENACTGYLAQFQQFAPALEQNCPDPAGELSITGQNLRSYGPACIDFVRSLAPCHFQTSGEIPGGISSECRAFAVDTFSYNGCVASHRQDADFLKNTWRLYLGSQYRLWDDTHDVVRLLDNSGEVVDALTY